MTDHYDEQARKIVRAYAKTRNAAPSAFDVCVEPDGYKEYETEAQVGGLVSLIAAALREKLDAELTMTRVLREACDDLRRVNAELAAVARAAEQVVRAKEGVFDSTADEVNCEVYAAIGDLALVTRLSPEARAAMEQEVKS